MKVVAISLLVLWTTIAVMSLGEYLIDKAYAQPVVGNVCAVTDPGTGHGFILGGM